MLDLNCLKVAARHTLQAAIVFLIKTIGEKCFDECRGKMRVGLYQMYR